MEKCFIKKRKEEEKIFVIGHKNPDTDSVVSAIVYSELKRNFGFDTVPAIANDVNPQTNFVLRKFKVKKPSIVNYAGIVAEEIMTKDPISIKVNQPLYHALKIMKENKIRFLPVLEEKGKVKGVITLKTLMSHLFSSLDRYKVVTSLSNIGRIFNKKIRENTLKEFKIVINDFDVKNSIVITDKKIKQFRNSNFYICCYKIRERKNVISVDKGIQDVLKLVLLSSPVGLIARNYEQISISERIEKIKEKLKERNFLLVFSNKLEGIITRKDLLRAKRKKFILVDHNELDQSIEGMEQADIIEIVDHHRIKAPETLYPIKVLCEPLGSTSTIIGKLFMLERIKPTKTQASLLISGILSDTLFFSSPTTTREDKNILGWLNKFAKLNIKKFFKQMCEASELLLYVKNTEELIKKDFKYYDTNRGKIGISQIETTDFNLFFEREEEIKETLKKIKEKENLYLISLMVTHVLEKKSIILLYAEKDVVRKIPYKKIKENIFEEKIVSRKKELLPLFLEILK